MHLFIAPSYLLMSSSILCRGSDFGLMTPLLRHCTNLINHDIHNRHEAVVQHQDISSDSDLHRVAAELLFNR
jgi:hypothetical protein